MIKNVLENRKLGRQEDDIEVELQQYKHKKREFVIPKFLKEDRGRVEAKEGSVLI